MKKGELLSVEMIILRLVDTTLLLTYYESSKISIVNKMEKF